MKREFYGGLPHYKKSSSSLFPYGCVSEQAQGPVGMAWGKQNMKTISTLLP
jgi:hypothetical protein